MLIKPVIKQDLSNHAKENLKKYIRAIDIRKTDKLPSEEKLAKELAVSRVTIRKALTELEQEGLILRIHGRGTFVNQEALQIKVNFGELMEFGSVIQQSGYESSMKLLDVYQKTADEYVAKRLHIEKDDPLICVERMYYADNHPVIYSIGCFAEAMAPSPVSKKILEENSNFDFLYSFAGRIVHQDIVNISTVSQDELKLQLGTKQELTCPSALCLEACAFDQDNIPVIYGKAFYNTDYIRFQLVRK